MTETSASQHKDPVCGKALNVISPVLCSDYQSHRYYFCSDRCKKAFADRTERWKLSERVLAGALFAPGGIRWGLS